MNALDATLSFQAQAVRVSSDRQRAVAANIANADTPNYKATDVDFASTLAKATQAAGGAPQVALAAPQTGHFVLTATQGNATSDVVYRTPLQQAVDKNTVDMDVEQAAFADNTVHYQAAFTFLNQEIKTLLTSVQG